MEAECHRNIELIWLMRTLKPDFKTIADFRAANRRAFNRCFANSRGCANGSICLDASFWRLTARASRRSITRTVITRRSLETFIKAADQRLDDYLQRLAEGDAAEAGTSGARVENLAKKIEALREKRGDTARCWRASNVRAKARYQLTDPDSRAMAAHTKVAVGYNVQVAVDAKNKMIVEPEVTNQVVDMGLLQATAEPARATL